MEVTFNNPKDPQITKLTVKRLVDKPEKKIVVAVVKEFKSKITLWENTSYDSIGQWTDSDVEARLNELYNN